MVYLYITIHSNTILLLIHRNIILYYYYYIIYSNIIQNPL